MSDLIAKIIILRITSTFGLHAELDFIEGLENKWFVKWSRWLKGKTIIDGIKIGYAYKGWEREFALVRFFYCFLIKFLIWIQRGSTNLKFLEFF